LQVEKENCGPDWGWIWLLTGFSFLCSYCIEVGIHKCLGGGYPSNCWFQLVRTGSELGLKCWFQLVRTGSELGLKLLVPVSKNWDWFSEPESITQVFFQELELLSF
jgi:hypothetical protein